MPARKNNPTKYGMPNPEEIKLVLARKKDITERIGNLFESLDPALMVMKDLVLETHPEHRDEHIQTILSYINKVLNTVVEIAEPNRNVFSFMGMHLRYRNEEGNGEFMNPEELEEFEGSGDEEWSQSMDCSEDY